MSAQTANKAEREARGSHEERSRRTRERVIEATVRLVSNGGASAATFTAIANEAGVSAGAVQHQFGDKAGLYVEVVEEGMNRLLAILTAASAEGASLGRRVDAFVDAAWAGYQDDMYGAATQILLHLRDEPSIQKRAFALVGTIRIKIDRVWMGMFWDAKVDRAQHIAAQRFAYSLMNGLALEGLLFGQIPDASEELRRLKQVLRHYLNCRDDTQ